MLKKLLKIRYQIEGWNVEHKEFHDKPKTISNYFKVPELKISECNKESARKGDDKICKLWNEFAKNAPKEEVVSTDKKITELNNQEEYEKTIVLKEFKAPIYEVWTEVRLAQLEKINKTIEQLPDNLVWNTQKALLNVLKQNLSNPEDTIV